MGRVGGLGGRLLRSLLLMGRGWGVYCGLRCI